ncbi:MAG: GDSL-type esterase/lipase family protein [Patescibacteria group bacterium]
MRGKKYLNILSGIFKGLVFIIILITPTIPLKAESLSNHLRGRILLQVENNGEAWYVHPTTTERYYMRNGGDAYNIMRSFGVGITNADLEKINNNKNLAIKQKGRIFLQVESRGEAYYVGFDGSLHYLKDGPEAYNTMKKLGLGISNKDLSYIKVNSSTFANQVHQIYSIGDSLTAFNTTNHAYLNSLLSLLGKKWNGNNFGIGGNYTAQMLARFNDDILSNLDAEYVIIWGGIVDVIYDVDNTAIESNLQAMYTAAHNTGLKVVALTLSPFKGSSGYTSGRLANLQTINTWIKNTATGIDYVVDTYPVLMDPAIADTLLSAYDYGDNLHLSVAGLDAIGLAIYNEVTWTKFNNRILDKNTLK